MGLIDFICLWFYSCLAGFCVGWVDCWCFWYIGCLRLVLILLFCGGVFCCVVSDLISVMGYVQLILRSVVIIIDWCCDVGLLNSVVVCDFYWSGFVYCCLDVLLISVLIVLWVLLWVSCCFVYCWIWVLLDC